MANRGLRDSDGSSTRRDPFQSVLDQPLGMRVERGGRLIQQQNTRVLENRTCDGNLQTT